MTFEQATDNQQASDSGHGSGGWGGLLSSALPLPMQMGLSLGTGFGSGLAHPTPHQAAPGQDAAPKEVGNKKDANPPGAVQAQVGIKDLDKKDRPPPSRAELMKNPELYGKPKDMSAAAFASQYADEYLAKLAYKDPAVAPDDKKSAVPGYSEADKKFLADWGYKFSTDVRDAKTGLYVAKFDPVDPKSGIAPVVSFRGTEGGSPDTRETIKDVKSDAAFSYIGQDQYESKKAEIAKLFQDPNGQKVDVTGHSLGGALAQKAAADNIARTHALTTFQAPGILQADADKFAKENQKYGVDVNHHYVTTDLVHRAGEAKLGGNFWEHTLPGVKGPDQLGGLQLPHSIDDIKRDLALGKSIGAGIGESHTTHDLLSARDQTIKKHASDPQQDRAKWEGLRKEAGKRLNDTHLFDAVQDGLDAKQHLDNAGAAWQTGKDKAGAAWNQGVAGAKDGVSEAGTGFSDLAHLNVKKGLSEIGHGAGSGIGNLVSGGWGFAKNLFGGAKNAGSELKSAGSDVIHAGQELHNGWGGIKSLASEGVGFVKDHRSELLGSAKAVAADGLHKLEQGPAGPVIQDVKNTLTHGRETVDHVVGAGSALKGGLQGAASSAGAGFQGAVAGTKQAGHGLSELAHLDVKHGLSDIGHGVSNGIGSAVQGTAGAASSLWQGAKGAVGQVGGALSSAKATGGSLVSSAKHLFGLFSH
jgi:hypothetical protein